MEIVIDLPDDIVRHVQEKWENVPRYVLESLALSWYQAGDLNEEQVRRLLGYRTRLRVHAFLKAHGVPLLYTLEDLDQDRATHEESKESDPIDPLRSRLRQGWPPEEAISGR